MQLWVRWRLWEREAGTCKQQPTARTAAGAGVEVGARSDDGPKKGMPPTLGSPFGLSTRCMGQGQLTEAAQTQPPHHRGCPDPATPRPCSLTVPLLCPDCLFPLPSGPPQRKPSSGVSPWRSCCFTNVSGGQRPVPPPCILSLSPFPGPSQESLLLGETEPGRKPLVWPWIWLLPAPPCPWELALPARGLWDLCGHTRIPRITINISTYRGLTLG